MKRMILLALVACACPSKQTAGPATGSASGSGSAAVPVVAATTCDGVKSKVADLYRAEAQAKEPKRVEAAVADNTAMVMADCNKDAARVVPCLVKAQTVADIEKQCVVQLDEEGTEGTR